MSSKSKRKKTQSRKQLSERTFEITLACALMSFSDISEFAIKDIPAFFNRFNENLVEFNKGDRRLMNLIAVIKEELGIDLRKV